MPGTTKQYENAKGLPKVTKSICPECGKVIDAEYYEKDGKVYAKKTCPEHGDYDNLIWSDVKNQPAEFTLRFLLREAVSA